jgi:lia operon protein LiaF
MAVSDFSGIGDQVIQPSTTAELENHYLHPFGDVTLDLTDIETFPEGTTDIEFDLFAGELEVILPDDLPVSIDVFVGAGDLSLFDESYDGGDLERSYKDEGFDSATRRLDLEIDNGAGGVRIRRESGVPFGPLRGPVAPAPPEAPDAPR